MSKNADELLDHSYDGIQEYDNPLPGWWSLIFIISVLFTIPYAIYYHFTEGHLRIDEWKADVAALEEMKKGGGGEVSTATNESLEALAQDPAAMAKGKEIFLAKCFMCHGKFGEGGIGPNMTDDYFLHGPTAMDRLKVITEGVPAKGMVPWKGQLTTEEIEVMAAYVGTLRGTTPPNPKPPQGTKAP